jgi:hypothetical protein
MAQVHPLHPGAQTEQQKPSQSHPLKAPAGAKADMPATVAKIMSDADWSNHELLPSFHASTKGFAEQVNQVNGNIKHVASEVQVSKARWDKYGDSKTHWSYIQKWVAWTLVVILMVSETALAATVMSGLDLTNIETYLVAFGTVIATTLAVKAMAYAWRRQSDDAHAGIPLNPKERWMLWFGLVGILLVLAGQVLARESYAEQVAATGGGGVTTMVAIALTLLHAGLYTCMGIGIFFLMPHVRTYEAELQYRSAFKELQNLHKKRQAIAGKLNEHVLTLKSNWALNQAKAKSAVYEHIAELGLHLERSMDSFFLDERLFKPVPEWVWPVVDPLPHEVQYLVNEGPHDQQEMQVRADHRQSIVQGKSATDLVTPATPVIPAADSRVAPAVEHAELINN